MSPEQRASELMVQFPLLIEPVDKGKPSLVKNVDFRKFQVAIAAQIRDAVECASIMKSVKGQ